MTEPTGTTLILEAELARVAAERDSYQAIVRRISFILAQLHQQDQPSLSCRIVREVAREAFEVAHTARFEAGVDLLAELASLRSDLACLRAIANAADEYVSSDHSDSVRAYGELVKAVKAWRGSPFDGAARRAAVEG